MRLGEILSLRWSRVNFEAGFIQVEHTKNGKIRKIPMNSLLKKTLKNVKKGAQGYVFMRNGKHVNSIRKPWEHALKQAGIEDCRFHDLRHNFATYALLHGADLISLRDILGHFDINMTTRYAHSSERLKQRAVEPLSGAFGGGGSGS